MKDIIEHDRVDASVIRMTSAIVAVVAFVAILAHSVWLVAFLAVDLLLRATGMGRYSLLERCGDELSHFSSFEPDMVDAAPERFAARVGFVFAFAATVLYAVDLLPAGSLVTAVLTLAAAVEAGTHVQAGRRFLSLLPERLAALLAR